MAAPGVAISSKIYSFQPKKLRNTKKWETMTHRSGKKAETAYEKSQISDLKDKASKSSIINILKRTWLKSKVRFDVNITSIKR